MKWNWTPEALEDLKVMANLNVEEELSRIMQSVNREPILEEEQVSAMSDNEKLFRIKSENSYVKYGSRLASVSDYLRDDESFYRKYGVLF